MLRFSAFILLMMSMAVASASDEMKKCSSDSDCTAAGETCLAVTPAGHSSEIKYCKKIDSTDPKDQPMEVCQVNKKQCNSGLMCIAKFSSNPQHRGAGVPSLTSDGPEDGLCMTCKKQGDGCKYNSASPSFEESCCPGMSCIPENDAQARTNPPTGKCKVLADLTAEDLQYTMENPPAGSELNCKYIPGQYVFFDEEDLEGEGCCGVWRDVRLYGSGLNVDKLNWVKYCDYATEGSGKSVSHGSFCGVSGVVPLEWGGDYTGENSGKCFRNNAHTELILNLDPGPSPSYEVDPNSCIAKFDLRDLEARVGHIDNYRTEYGDDEGSVGKVYGEASDELVGTGLETDTKDFYTNDQRKYEHWFTSQPSAGFYRNGDELFVLAFIWLFQNTDVDSRAGANFKGREIAQKLYDIFKPLEEAYKQIYTYYDMLRGEKGECLAEAAKVYWKIRWDIAHYLHDGYLRAVRGYQCGQKIVGGPGTYLCSDEDPFLNDSIKSFFTLAERDHGGCSSALQGCHKDENLDGQGFVVNTWQDNQRNGFYCNTFCELTNCHNLCDLVQHPHWYHNVAIDALVDPPVKLDWAPTKLTENKAHQLFGIANQNSGLEIEMSKAGAVPPRHWSLILKKSKFVEAFPFSGEFKSAHFLHLHGKMDYLSTKGRESYLTQNNTTGVDESEYWNGPHAVGNEAVRIMELYSMLDTCRATESCKELAYYTAGYLKLKLMRLMQFYTQRSLAYDEEKTCITEKLKQTMIDFKEIPADTEEINPLAINIVLPRCADGVGGGGNVAVDGSTSESNEAAAVREGAKGAVTEGNQHAAGKLPTGGKLANVNIDSGGVVTGGSTDRLGDGATSEGASETLAKMAAASNAMREAAEKQKNGLLAKRQELGRKVASSPLGEEVKKYSALAAKGRAKIAAIVNKPLTPAKGAKAEDLAKAREAMAKTKGEAKVAMKEKKFGTLAEPEMKKKKFGVLSSNANKAGKKLASKTGLKPKEEKRILKNINEKEYASNKRDSIWTKVSKAYVRSYKILFSPE